MSVLIKGAKPPSGCAFCYFNDDSKCALIPGCNYDETNGWRRRDDCPLVELPDHGDLIDRDAMAKGLAYDVEMDEKALDDTDIVGIERENLQFDKDCKQNCMYYLTEQDPVIPAERSE